MRTPIEIPLWDDITKAPYYKPEDATTQEYFVPREDGGNDAISRLTNVVNPTITVYKATTNKPGPAVLICPGGGYSILAYSHEGEDIAAWFNANSITAIVLKYRCPDRRDAALADAIRAMRIIRSRAAEFCIDPDKIGVLGFSAGANLAGRVSNMPTPDEVYAPQDEIDSADHYPNYSFIIYPAYFYEPGYEINPEIKFTDKTPPAFIMQAEDDKPYVDSSIAYFVGMKRASRPAELHIFPRGGHGYGIFRNGNPTQEWPDLAMNWFKREIMQGKPFIG
jgi:acetyl esterase/lipase